MMVVAAILLLIFAIRSYSWTKKSYNPFGLFIGIMILLFLPWAVLKLYMHINSNPREHLAFEPILKNIHQLVPVTNAFAREMFSFDSWNYIWMFVFVGLVIFIIRVKHYKELLPLWILFILQLFVYWGVYVFMLGGSVWYLENSLSRTLVGIMPLAFYAALLTLFKKESITDSRA